jgi:hypothetical protein
MLLFSGGTTEADKKALIGQSVTHLPFGIHPLYNVSAKLKTAQVALAASTKYTNDKFVFHALYSFFPASIVNTGSRPSC